VETLTNNAVFTESQKQNITDPDPQKGFDFVLGTQLLLHFRGS
jgi:hypothetical protein